jgi:citrate lyase beta subunit
VYGGGHLFRADTVPKLGGIALRALDEFAPTPWELARAVGLPGHEGLPRTPENAAALLERVARAPDVVRAESPGAWLAATLYARVREKLHREPVEDYRIDFEDGYGARGDAEEDAHASAAANEVARGLRQGLLSPFVGIRVKPLNQEWTQRSGRTLELFLRTLLSGTAGVLPPGFVVTLPKITVVEQVAYFARRLRDLEREHGLMERALRFEVMVETPQLIVDATGRCPLPQIIVAGDGRITGAHFGTYDYSASLGIAASRQRMRHQACQHALRVMQASLAGTGIRLSDGATTVLPVPVHRTAADGAPLSAAERARNRAAIHAAWRLHFEDVRHSLANGLYQGWDLHPAQLPTRYAALYSFFLEGLDAAATRLRSFLDHAAQATLVGDVFDDAATGQGLLNYFLRAVGSGAVSADEMAARTGLTGDDLRERSFLRILARRRDG